MPPPETRPPPKDSADTAPTGTLGLGLGLTPLPPPTPYKGGTAPPFGGLTRGC